jgi:hypothetical protein
LINQYPTTRDESAEEEKRGKKKQLDEKLEADEATTDEKRDTRHAKKDWVRILGVWDLPIFFYGSSYDAGDKLGC